MLREYLADREVAELMFGYFDYEKELEFLRQEEREEGRAEGALRTLANLVKKGRMTPAEAAEEANMTVAEFENRPLCFRYHSIWPDINRRRACHD